MYAPRNVCDTGIKSLSLVEDRESPVSALLSNLFLPRLLSFSTTLFNSVSLKEYQLLRLLDMSEVHTVASVAMKKNENAFGIVTPKRTYYVKASSNSEMLSWIENLMNVKTQLQMRSTLTQELAAADISGVTPATIPNPSKVKRTPSKERSPNVSESSNEGGAPISSRPMSITIPGQGTYISPAQPRPIPSPGALSIPNNRNGGGSSNLSPQSGGGGGQAFSPLTSTSVSGGSGSDNGAEHYGLSYQSSGFSASSSPTRTTAGDPINNLSHSPQSGGETSDGSRRVRSNSKSRNRSRGEGSSEGIAGDRPVSPSRGNSKSGGYFGSSGTGVQQATTPGAAGALSSSDEEEDDGDGDGEDWDEDEIADQAMPLPGLIQGPTSSSTTTATSSQPPQTQQPTNNALSPNSQVRTIVQPPSQLKDPSKIIMQGYLMKQSSRRKHWRKRWFVLNGKDLTYSRSHMDSKNNRQIPLSSILDAIEYTSKKGNHHLGGNHSSPLSPPLASPTATHQSFNFGNAVSGNHEESIGEKNGMANEREVEKGHLGEENQPTPSNVQPPKVERRTSLVAAAANIGERLGGVTSNQKSSEHSNNNNNFSTSTSPTIGGTSPLPSSSTPKKKKENCFKIITPKRTFVVCAPTEEEEIKWLGAIQALLTRSRGSTTTTNTTVTSSNLPANHTTGFTLTHPNNDGTVRENQQSNEVSNNTSTHQQGSNQVAPAAGEMEETGALPMP